MTTYVTSVRQKSIHFNGWQLLFAGSFEQYTPPGLYEEHGGVVICKQVVIYNFVYNFYD